MELRGVSAERGTEQGLKGYLLLGLKQEDRFNYVIYEICFSDHRSNDFII